MSRLRCCRQQRNINGYLRGFEAFGTGVKLALGEAITWGFQDNTLLKASLWFLWQLDVTRPKAREPQLEPYKEL